MQLFEKNVDFITTYVLGYPHSVKLYGSGVKNELNYIVMQLLGPNLAHVRRTCPVEPQHFSVGTVLRISQACVESLRDLHGINIVHRDIKPVISIKLFVFVNRSYNSKGF